MWVPGTEPRPLQEQSVLLTVSPPLGSTVSILSVAAAEGEGFAFSSLTLQRGGYSPTYAVFGCFLNNLKQCRPGKMAL